MLVVGLGVGAMAGAGAAGTEPTGFEYPTRFEYLVKSPSELAGLDRPFTMDELMDLEKMQEYDAAAYAQLQRLGGEGWELVDVEERAFYFKRPLNP